MANESVREIKREFLMFNLSNPMLNKRYCIKRNFRTVRTLGRIFIRAHITFVTYNPYHNHSFPRQVKSSLGLKVYGPVCCLGPGQMFGSSDINQSIKLTGRSTFDSFYG